jgi:hypothetical protein
LIFDIDHIGVRKMSQVLSRSVALVLAANVALILWVNTLAPMAA